MNEKKLESTITNKTEKTLLELTQGIRKPETEFEKQVAKEIKDIEEKGGTVEIPFDT